MIVLLLNRVNRGGLSRFGSLAVLLFITLLMGGCGEEGESAADTVKPVTLEYAVYGNTLSLTVAREKITVAGELEIRLLAKAPVGSVIDFAEPPKEFDGFTLLGTAEVENIHDPKGEYVAKTLNLKYEPEMSGSYTLPEFVVKFISGNGTESVVKSETLSVEVLSQIPQLSTAKLKDIPGIIALKRDYTLWFVFGGIGALLLILVGVIILVNVLRKRAAYRVICKPFFTALKQLDNLEKSGRIEQGQNNIVYTEVSDILRFYIEERFAIQASKSTTEEFLAQISDNNLMISSYSHLLRDFLQKCDVVKFAKYAASESESHGVIASCRRFVLSTKRAEIEYHGEFGELPATDGNKKGER